MSKKTKPNKDRLEKELKKLREKELDVFSQYIQSPWKLMWTNFLTGTAKGVGFFLGAAIVIAILGYVLGSFLSSLPVVGDFFEAAAHFIEQNQPNTPKSE